MPRECRRRLMAEIHSPKKIRVKIRTATQSQIERFCVKYEIATPTMATERKKPGGRVLGLKSAFCGVSGLFTAAMLR